MIVICQKVGPRKKMLKTKQTKYDHILKCTKMKKRKKKKRKSTHHTWTHTHRLRSQTTHSSIMSMLTKEALRKARLGREEGVSEGVLPPGGCGTTSDWTAFPHVTQGFIELTRSSGSTVRTAVRTRFIHHPRAAVFTSWSTQIFPLRDDTECEGAFQPQLAMFHVWRRVRLFVLLCGTGLVMWPLTWPEEASLQLDPVCTDEELDLKEEEQSAPLDPELLDDSSCLPFSLWHLQTVVKPHESCCISAEYIF